METIPIEFSVLVGLTSPQLRVAPDGNPRNAPGVIVSDVLLTILDFIENGLTQ